MALLPLTMCRNGLSRLSNTRLRRVLPFNRVTAMHIHLGYTMVFIVFLSTLVFFLFFGIMCQEQKVGVEPLGKAGSEFEGEKTFCDKFTSEIMITGYVIMGLLLLVALTSFLRNVIPYEVFYIVHHLVFLMFACAVLHTNDDRQREQLQERSQTFKWFSFTLFYYVFDRAYMWQMETYTVRAISTEALGEQGNGAKVVILRLPRPIGFEFVPGNYAFLSMGKADDPSWHPFSIGSDPNSDTLDFYIQVFSDSSWTGRLFSEVNEKNRAGATLTMKVMGPYGASVGHLSDFTHSMLCGTGTGIVPMLSYLQHHLHSTRALEPEEYFRNHAREREARYLKQVRDAFNSKTLFEYLMTLIFRTYFYFFDYKGFLIRLEYANLTLSELEAKTLAVEYLQTSQRLWMLQRYGKKSAMARELVSRVKREERKNERGLFFALIPVFMTAALAITLSWNNMTKSEFSNVTSAMKSTATQIPR